MVEEGKAVWEAEVTKDTLDALQQVLVTEHKERFSSEAEKQAKAEYEAEVLERVQKYYKEKLIHEIEEEWKTKETKRIKTAIKLNSGMPFQSWRTTVNQAVIEFHASFHIDLYIWSDKDERRVQSGAKRRDKNMAFEDMFKIHKERLDQAYKDEVLQKVKADYRKQLLED
ncbi:MAG: hypothetical protein Q9161_006750 [Pseudevernia consocians]